MGLLTGKYSKDITRAYKEGRDCNSDLQGQYSTLGQAANVKQTRVSHTLISQAAKTMCKRVVNQPHVS
eukprot:scaffold22679_cov146-Cylindrotheca_fusiformis.AAC.3